MSQNQTPDQAAIARFVNLDFSSGPMTDAWLQYQFAGALTVAKMRFGETEAGRAAVLRGFANRILLGQASAAEAALAVPFTENPAEPPAGAAPAPSPAAPRPSERACSNCAHEAADALADPCHGCAGFGDPDSGPSGWEPKP